MDLNKRGIVEKPPEVKRLRTKLSSIRNCLQGISSLIQNVPPEAIDTTRTSETTMSEENENRPSSSVFHGYRPYPHAMNAPFEFRVPQLLPIGSTGGSGSSGLSCNPRSTTSGSLSRLSSGSIELIRGGSTSCISDSYYSSHQSSSTSSIGRSLIVNTSGNTETSSVNSSGQPMSQGMTIMQVLRGKSGDVVVTGACPPQQPQHSSSTNTNSQVRVTCFQTENKPGISVVRKGVQLVEQGSSAIDGMRGLQCGSSGVSNWPPSGTLTEGSSGIEFSIYPSHPSSSAVDEEVLNENLRNFMSEEEDEEWNPSQSSPLPTPEISRQGGHSMDLSRGDMMSSSVHHKTNPPPQPPSSRNGGQRSKGPRPRRRSSRSSFNPVANSTSINGNLDMGTPQPPDIPSSLEVDVGPSDEQRNVGTQTRGSQVTGVGGIDGGGAGVHRVRGSDGKVYEYEKKYPCPLCPQKFPFPNLLKTHTETVHQKVRLKCPSCPLEFRNGSNLRKHLYIKHNNNGEPMVCIACKKEFDDYLSYQRHRRTHWVRKDISCPNCKFRFTSSYDVSVHFPGGSLRVDDPNEGLLECKACAFQTNYATSFRRHVKTRLHLRRLAENTEDYVRLQAETSGILDEEEGKKEDSPDETPLPVPPIPPAEQEEELLTTSILNLTQVEEMVESLKETEEDTQPQTTETEKMGEGDDGEEKEEETSLD